MEQGVSDEDCFVETPSRVFQRDDYEWTVDRCNVPKMEDFDYLFTWDDGVDDKHITSFLTLVSGGLVQYGKDGDFRLLVDMKDEMRCQDKRNCSSKG